MHAAQGLTVDTSHAVLTQRSALAALYVAMTRGREANTAHVATRASVEDPARGSERAPSYTATRLPSSPAR